MSEKHSADVLPGEAPADWWSAKRKAAIRIFRNEGVSGIWRKIGAGGPLEALSRVGDEIRCMQCALICSIWDKRHHTQTSGLIGMEQVSVVGSNKEHGTAIVSISPRMFKFLTRFFPVDRSNATLVDFGSGKGRLALLASTVGFRKVIGVEYSPFAHNIAQENLKNFRAGGDGMSECVFINADAVDFQLPTQGPLMLVFNNPFGLEVWRRVLPNIVSHRKETGENIRLLLSGSMPEVLAPVVQFVRESGHFTEAAQGVSPLFIDSYSRYYYWVFDAA
ncbi:methyltransferase domain-containing protein [Methylocapsa palsarum]|uniref:Methyltransferase domain-containing protein n=1 Tax=Methylocapsa palsarum TaxID=1612308 RepID=A0A1I4C0L8_9HYPH|nr:methyltransferase domain-containing protein [Methylocapsa palsarum]SFK74602.1 Methyltransferase domain-containing protein [Methylocapsa palsarum]